MRLFEDIIDTTYDEREEDQGSSQIASSGEETRVNPLDDPKPFDVLLTFPCHSSFENNYRVLEERRRIIRIYLEECPGIEEFSKVMIDTDFHYYDDGVYDVTHSRLKRGTSTVVYFAIKSDFRRASEMFNTICQIYRIIKGNNFAAGDSEIHFLKKDDNGNWIKDANMLFYNFEKSCILNPFRVYHKKKGKFDDVNRMVQVAGFIQPDNATNLYKQIISNYYEGTLEQFYQELTNSKFKLSNESVAYINLTKSVKDMTLDLDKFLQSEYSYKWFFTISRVDRTDYRIHNDPSFFASGYDNSGNDFTKEMNVIKETFHQKKVDGFKFLKYYIDEDYAEVVNYMGFHLGPIEIPGHPLPYEVFMRCYINKDGSEDFYRLFRDDLFIEKPSEEMMQTLAKNLKLPDEKLQNL